MNAPLKVKPTSSNFSIPVVHCNEDRMIMNGTPRAFDLSVEHLEDVAIVRVTGEIDMDTAPRLESTLTRLAEGGARLITVDLAETDFLDSTGLNALVIALRRMRTLGGDLVLQAPSRPAARVLELSGLSTVVKVIHAG